jgi:hypothetical protein
MAIVIVVEDNMLITNRAVVSDISACEKSYANENAAHSIIPVVDRELNDTGLMYCRDRDMQ